MQTDEEVYIKLAGALKVYVSLSAISFTSPSRRYGEHRLRLASCVIHFQYCTNALSGVPERRARVLVRNRDSSAFYAQLYMSLSSVLQGAYLTCTSSSPAQEACRTWDTRRSFLPFDAAAGALSQLVEGVNLCHMDGWVCRQVDMIQTVVQGL